MREEIRDIDRLQHILEQIDLLGSLVPELSFESLDVDIQEPSQNFDAAK